MTGTPKHPPALMATMLALVAVCLAAIVLLATAGGVVWLLGAVLSLMAATTLVVVDTYDLMDIGGSDRSDDSDLSTRK